ncbi:MAG TPA: SusC/RagA family TonB-linked outer membrane protein [Gemmatimonadaceae bacterium]|nr:SusC/RagA family TonB-linked outer membrane protein [Gemmatimonadaceae bacterium]
MRLGRWKLVAINAAALLLLALSGGSLRAQGTITGRVTAQGTNEPVGDARVTVVGTSAATATTQDGRYTIRNAPAGAHEVRVLRVGYQEQKKSVTVTAGQTVTVDFSLAASVVKLQDVVTTATGEQRKVELGNAISTLGDVSNRVETSTITNLADLMVAKAPGVVVLPASMTGAAPVVRIRGLNSLSLNNDPIYIVDGIRISSGTIGVSTGGTSESFLNTLSPDEIEDVEIVKGPSAATLYGTDAANGVIVITTKKGRAGNTKWTWSAEQGQVKDRNNYPAQYALWGHNPASPATQIRCLMATNLPAGTCVVDSTTSLNILSTPGITPLTTGNRNQYGVQMSGGSEAVRFFVGGSLENELGPLKMPDFSVARFNAAGTQIRDEWMHPEQYQQENLRANLTASLSPTFDLTVNTGFAKTDQRLPQVDNNSFSYLYNAWSNPGFQHSGLGYSNIGALGEDKHGYAFFTPGDIFQRLVQTGIQRITASTNASWRPLSWMQNDGTVGIDLAVRDNLTLCRFNECPNSGTTRQGSITDAHNNNRDFTAKVMSTSTWQARSWANLKSTIGADYLNAENDGSSASGSQLPPGAQTVGAAAVLSASNIPATAVKTLGLYIQEQASLRDRLFVTLAVRTDQNSAFGTNFQRVIYPKASVSWILSDESFFPKFSWLDQFRLRSAYGASGVQPGATSSLQTFTASTVNINSVDTPGLRANALGNANLKPEKSSEFEGGFDARMWNSRLNLELTYYSKQTRDALINLPIAPNAAPSTTSVIANIASVKNDGVEATVNAQLVDLHQIGWDVTITASHNSNKVVSLGTNPSTGKPYPTIGTGSIRDTIGLPVNALFYRTYTWSDANKDGYISTSEVTVNPNFSYMGSSQPRDIVSLQNGFDLLNRLVRINVLLDYKGGYSLYNATTSFYCQQTNSCYTESNQKSALWDQARLVALRYQNPSTGAGYLDNGQFWRLREVSAVVNLPRRVTRFLGHAESANLTLGARNLHLWTKYTGVDPEENYNSSGTGTGDVQNTFSTTAPPTYFTLRLNLHY